MLATRPSWVLGATAPYPGSEGRLLSRVWKRFRSFISLTAGLKRSQLSENSITGIKMKNAIFWTNYQFIGRAVWENLLTIKIIYLCLYPYKKTLRWFLPTPFPFIFYRPKNTGASNWSSCLTPNFTSSLSRFETTMSKWSYPSKQHLPHCKLYTKSSSYCSWITRSVDLCYRQNWLHWTWNHF